MVVVKPIRYIVTRHYTRPILTQWSYVHSSQQIYSTLRANVLLGLGHVTRLCGTTNEQTRSNFLFREILLYLIDI